ncbi:MAG: hypothetical protein U1F35_22595 [Steroidobacteraceae bacterium]
MAAAEDAATRRAAACNRSWVATDNPVTATTSGTRAATQAARMRLHRLGPAEVQRHLGPWSATCASETIDTPLLAPASTG